MRVGDVVVLLRHGVIYKKQGRSCFLSLPYNEPIPLDKTTPIKGKESSAQNYR